MNTPEVWCAIIQNKTTNVKYFIISNTSSHIPGFDIISGKYNFHLVLVYDGVTNLFNTLLQI